MTCRIGVDSGAVARLIVKHRPAQGEHGSLGCSQRSTYSLERVR
jgi:hypothetical protein